MSAPSPDPFNLFQPKGSLYDDGERRQPAVRLLSLSSEQTDVIGALVDAYFESLTMIEWNRSLVERGPGAVAAPVDAPASPERVIEDVLRAAGIDLARVRGGDLQLSVSIGISRIDDGQPPRMNVHVKLGPREGVTISAEERATLTKVAEQLAEAFERTELERPHGPMSGSGAAEAAAAAAASPGGDPWARFRADIEQGRTNLSWTQRS